MKYKERTINRLKWAIDALVKLTGGTGNTFTNRMPVNNRNIRLLERVVSLILHRTFGNFKFEVSIVSAIIFGSILSAGCSSFYTVKGTVTSCATGAPISGAQVDLKMKYDHTVKEGQSQSNESGAFRVLLNHPSFGGDSEMTVAADNYETQKKTVHHSFEEQQSLCLEQKP